MESLSQRQAPPVPFRPDENQGPTILGATLTVTIAALLTMIARLYVRLRMIRNIGWDDYLMISAMVLCIAGQCIIIPQVYYGAGRHIEYIRIPDFKTSFKLNFITQPLYLFAICLTKLSVGFFLLRFAVEPFYRRLTIGIMSFMSFYTIGCFLTIVLQCTDLRVQWDHSVKGTCWSSQTLQSLSYTNQSLNILTDIAFSLAIPIPMLWNVQLNRRQRASILATLSLGLFATAAALVKLSYVSSYGRSGDWLWDSRNLTIWTVVECNIAIVAGSLPCLKPLLRSVLDSTYGRGSRKTEPSNHMSRPCGPCTYQRSKDYSEIHSNKTREDSYTGYGSSREAYMLTTIGAQKQNGGDLSRMHSGRSSPNRGKSSSESVARLNDKNGFATQGGIAVTTKVDVTESHICDDRRLPGRQTTKELV